MHDFVKLFLFAMFGQALIISLYINFYRRTLNVHYNNINDEIAKPYIPPKPLYDYKSFRGDRELRLHCGTCALVFSSGHLLGSGKGNEIDSRDCVFRSHFAPTLDYEQDVGFKTTFRTVTCRTFKLMLEKMTKLRKDGKPLFDQNLPANTIVLLYGLQKASETDKTLKLWPDMRLHIVSSNKFNSIAGLFKPIATKSYRISNGFITLNIAIDICDEIHVYGMPEASQCDNVVNNKTTDVWYHYFETEFGKECDHYLHTLNVKIFGHHFLSEKDMYRNWMENSTTLFFHAPDWL